MKNTTAFQLEETPEMRKNRKRVLNICKPDGVPVDLDLADDEHYTFLLNQRGGGDYLKNFFPQDFHLIQKTREHAIKTKKANTPFVPKHVTLLEKVANGEDVSDKWHDAIQITGFIAQENKGTQTDYTVQATGIVSFVEGLKTFSATMQIYNTDTGDIISSNNLPTLYERGYDTIISSSGTTTDLDSLEASLVVDYLPYGSSTKSTKLMKIELQDVIEPSSEIVVTDPTHKAAVPNEGFIKVCMGRHDSDCDYKYVAQPQPDPPTPTVAVAGCVTYQGTITAPSADSDTFGALLFLKKRDGGATQLFTDPNTIFNFFSVTNNNTINWNFPPAQFEKAPWTQGNEVDINLTVQISVDPGAKNAQFQVTSLQDVSASMSVAKIDVLKFFWGCLSDDTLVRMHNGSEKRIDSIEVGDMVRGTMHGECLKVTDIVTGEEEKPCLRVTTEYNRSILMTDKHPVMKKNEICFARELCVGDHIQTEFGFEKIEMIVEEEYDGVVYNLKLGRENGEKLNGATHYANGLLVGDGNMQGALLDKRKAEKIQEPSLKEIPEKWRFDVANSRRYSRGETLVSV